MAGEEEIPASVFLMVQYTSNRTLGRRQGKKKERRRRRWSAVGG
jgi:hypothetical protein